MRRWRRLYAHSERAQWPPSAAERPCPRRGDCRCPPTGGMPCPRRPSVARLNGGNGGSVPGVVSLLERCAALRLLWHRLRFDQERTLGAPNAPVGPSHLDARPERVASEGRCGGVKRGIRNPEGVLAPSCLRRQTAAKVHALRGRKVASTGCAAVSAEGKPSADGKEKGQAAVSAERLTLC